MNERRPLQHDDMSRRRFGALVGGAVVLTGLGFAAGRLVPDGDSPRQDNEPDLDPVEAKKLRDAYGVFSSKVREYTTAGAYLDKHFADPSDAMLKKHFFVFDSDDENQNSIRYAFYSPNADNASPDTSIPTILVTDNYYPDRTILYNAALTISAYLDEAGEIITKRIPEPIGSPQDITPGFFVEPSQDVLVARAIPFFREPRLQIPSKWSALPIEKMWERSDPYDGIATNLYQSIVVDESGNDLIGAVTGSSKVMVAMHRYDAEPPRSLSV